MKKTTYEFSRPLVVEGIDHDKSRTEEIEASEAECAALCARLGLRELSELKSEMVIRRVIGGANVHIEGRFSADVVQTCVISLRDVHSRAEGHFETYFSEDVTVEEAESYDPDLEDSEQPEAVVNGKIDLGELVAQYLSLEIDPYPRAPGISLAAQMVETGQEAEPKNNPFQVLAGLKGEDKK